MKMQKYNILDEVAIFYEEEYICLTDSMKMKDGIFFVDD